MPTPAVARLVGGGAAAALSAYAVAGNDPKTVADFEAEYYRTGGADTTFASMVSFARASDATFVDSNGVIQTASSGVARVGHHKWNGSAWVDKGLLLETEARTNEQIRSEELDDAEWTKSNTTVTSNDAVAPDGNTTADKVAANGTANQHFITSVTDINFEMAVSCFAKSDTANFIHILIEGVNNYAQWNLSTGALVHSSGIDAAFAEDYGDGWWRFTMVTSIGAAGRGYRFYPLENSNDTAGPSETSSVSMWLWGIQAEEGSISSSYIPTVAAQVTRAAETLTIAGADMAASTTAMSFQMDGELDYVDEGAAAQQTFFRWRTDASNFVSMDLDTDGAATGEINANQAESGTVDTVVAGVEYTAGLATAFNIASRNTSGAINVAKDGTAATEDATPTALPDLSATTFDLGFDFMGTIALFRQWDVDLGDAGIEEASA